MAAPRGGIQVLRSFCTLGIFAPLASIQDPDCKDFYRKFKDIYPREEGEVIEIFVQANNTFKECYVKSAGKYGWCPGVGNSEVHITFSFK